MRVKGGNDYLSLVIMYIPSYYEGCVVFVIVKILLLFLLVYRYFGPSDM